jgi:hypothetical protein
MSLDSRPSHDELATDYRARLAHEAALAQERRQADLAAQVSIHNTPAERIRIWERVHGLSLPRDPGHRLLLAVAAGTELALDQVQEEQRQRFAARKAVAV